MRKMRFALLALLLPLMFAACAGAQEYQKEEIIYALIENDGRVADAYAVNCFECAQAVKIIDYGAYESVLNITTLEDIVYEDGCVTFDAPEGRFRYQGRLQAPELPWHITVSYTLNGEAIDADALSGRAGRMGCRVQVVRQAGFEAFTGAYTLQISAALDGARALAIDAPGATLAASGGSYTLSYVLLPGRDGDFTFSADVTDFSMAALTFAGIRMQMDFTLDLSAYEAQMSTLSGLLSAADQNAQNTRQKARALADALPEGSALRESAEALVSSANGAANTTHLLSAALSQMNLQEMAGSMTASLMGTDFETVSFLSDRNETSRVQFVLMTRAIAKQAVQATIAPAKPSLTLWERVCALFGL